MDESLNVNVQKTTQPNQNLNFWRLYALLVLFLIVLALSYRIRAPENPKQDINTKTNIIIYPTPTVTPVKKYVPQPTPTIRTLQVTPTEGKSYGALKIYSIA